MRDGFAVHTAEGALGGVLGTLLVKRAAVLGRKVPERIAPPVPTRDPAGVIIAALERIAGRSLRPETRGTVAEGLQWAYGIGWGGLLGVAVAGLGVKRMRDALLAGAAMGGLVWAVGYLGWLPRVGAMRPVKAQRAGRVAASLLSHVAYGLAAGVPIALIDEARRRRMSAWQRLAARLG